MRIVRVMSSDPSCEPNCPEWLSLEGQIMPGAAAAFADAVSHLGGRRLPILIHSHGGAVADALTMGRLIRAKGLAVGVARTLIANCPGTASPCAVARGAAITGGAACASACALILAGGIERLVGPVPLVGVHQITTVLKRTEGVAHLTSTRKLYEQGWIDERVTDYLTAMGVGDPVMTWLRITPAASIHWLSIADLSASHLATLALDAAEPVVSNGANGLNGRAFDSGSPRDDLVRASITEPLAGRGVTLEIAFRYRRGGGAVEADVTEREVETGKPANPPASDWSLTLTSAGGEPLQLSTAGTAHARAIMPRERFCALAKDGKLVAEPARAASAEEAAQEPLAAFAVVTMDGAKTLIDEACP
jgi:hypothetical protein